jgi:hypothetical protein
MVKLTIFGTGINGFIGQNRPPYLDINCIII